MRHTSTPFQPVYWNVKNVKRRKADSKEEDSGPEDNEDDEMNG